MWCLQRTISDAGQKVRNNTASKIPPGYWGPQYVERSGSIWSGTDIDHKTGLLWSRSNRMETTSWLRDWSDTQFPGYHIVINCTHHTEHQCPALLVCFIPNGPQIVDIISINLSFSLREHALWTSEWKYVGLRQGKGYSQGRGYSEGSSWCDSPWIILLPLDWLTSPVVGLTSRNKTGAD